MRTIRRDVERLRTLGYPIDATPGVRPAGPRLGAGGSLPHLLLDEEEAVVAAACGPQQASAWPSRTRALAKLEQMSPQLRRG